jgi:hypothetical protein
MIRLWPWRNRHPTPLGGHEALERQTKVLEETRGRWHEVLDAAETMRGWDHGNHFAQSLDLAYSLKRERST